MGSCLHFLKPAQVNYSRIIQQISWVVIPCEVNSKCFTGRKIWPWEQILVDFWALDKNITPLLPEALIQKHHLYFLFWLPFLNCNFLLYCKGCTFFILIFESRGRRGSIEMQYEKEAMCIKCAWCFQICSPLEKLYVPWNCLNVGVYLSPLFSSEINMQTELTINLFYNYYYLPMDFKVNMHISSKPRKCITNTQNIFPGKAGRLAMLSQMNYPKSCYLWPL